MLDPATTQLTGQIDWRAQMLTFQDGFALIDRTTFVLMTFLAPIQKPTPGLKTETAH